MRLFAKMIDRTQACVWLLAQPLTLCMLSSLIEKSYLTNLDSSLFVRLHDFDGYLHSTYNLTSLTRVKSRIECASLCMKNPECGSFFYLDEPKRLCQTHSVLFLTTDEAAVTSSASYYKLTQARCPQDDGYILYRPFSLCYRYFQTNVSWSVAKQSCQAIQNHLIDVKTSNISEHLVNFLMASSIARNAHVSVGANLLNGTWYWSDGTTATWTNWASGEPTGRNEQCLAIAWFYYFKWNDVPCTGNTIDLQRSYICQIDI